MPGRGRARGKYRSPLDYRSGEAISHPGLSPPPRRRERKVTRIQETEPFRKVKSVSFNIATGNHSSGRVYGQSILPETSDTVFIESRASIRPVSMSPGASDAVIPEKEEIVFSDSDSEDEMPKTLTPKNGSINGSLLESTTSSETKHDGIGVLHTENGIECVNTNVDAHTNNNLLQEEDSERGEEVDDFEDPGNFPVSGLAERVTMIRQVEITSFNDINDFMIKSKYDIQFVQFTFKMNAWYNANAKFIPKPAVKDLVKGGHYVAYSPTTKNWCRVALLNWKGNGEVLLEMLDRGGSMHTLVQYMRLIRKPFCNFPIQSTRAKIHLQPEMEPMYIDIDELRSKFEDKEKSWWAITVDDEMDAAGKPVVSVILLQYLNSTMRPLTFGKQIDYGYQLGSWKLNFLNYWNAAGRF